MRIGTSFFGVMPDCLTALCCAASANWSSQASLVGQSLQRNLRWNSGNREGGREDEGSVYSGRSRGSSLSGSRHGGSVYGADRSAHAGERSVHGGDRSVHGASRLGLNGSNHGEDC